VDDETPDNRKIDPEDESAPRWVKVIGVVALLLVLIVVVIHLSGGGFHGHSLQ